MLQLLFGVAVIIARIYIYATEYPMESSATIVLVNLLCLVLGGSLTVLGVYSLRSSRSGTTSTASSLNLGIADEGEAAGTNRQAGSFGTRRVRICAALLVALVSALTAMELRAKQRMEEGRQAEARAAREKERLSERLGLRWAIQAQYEHERFEGQTKLDRARESLESAIRAAPERLRLTNLRREYASPSIRGKVVILMRDDQGAAIVAGRVSRTRGGVSIHNLFDRLPDEIRARSLEEIETIALLRVSEEQTGVYVKVPKSWPTLSGQAATATPTKMFGYVVIYRMELIDNLMGAIIAERSFRGSPPPASREGIEGMAGKVYGAAPDDEVLEFLERLPRRQAGKSQETDKAQIGATYGGEWRGVARNESGYGFRISFTVNAEGRVEGVYVYVGWCCGWAFKSDQAVEIRGKTFEVRVRATTPPYYEGVVRGNFGSPRLAGGRIEVKTGQNIDCGGGNRAYFSNGYGEDWHAMRKEWRFPLEEEKGGTGCR